MIKVECLAWEVTLFCDGKQTKVNSLNSLGVADARISSAYYTDAIAIGPVPHEIMDIIKSRCQGKGGMVMEFDSHIQATIQP